VPPPRDGGDIKTIQTYYTTRPTSRRGYVLQGKLGTNIKLS
jgi:hypothetical protein